MITELSINDVLLESAQEVFETMICMELAEALEPASDNSKNDFLGLITFKGDINGCLGISCGCRCAKVVTRNMLGMEPDEHVSDEDVADAVGEITNMIMGAVKVRMEQQVGEINVSIPSVIRGREMTSTFGDSAQKTSVPVSIEDEHQAELSFIYTHEKTDS